MFAVKIIQLQLRKQLNIQITIFFIARYAQRLRAELHIFIIICTAGKFTPRT